MIEIIKKHFKKIIIALLGIFTLTAAASTVLMVPQGGTGTSTLTGVVVGNGTGALTTNTTGALASDLNIDSDTFVISYDDNNVGFRTNAPVGRIHVVGNDATKKGALGFVASDKQNSSSIYVQGDGFGYFIAADTTNDIEFTSGVSSLGEGMVNTATLHALDIRTNNVSRIHIQADGDVGIGTKTPTYNFELATGKTFGIGTTQWSSADEIDGTKIKDADYGDVVIDAAGDWQVSEATALAANGANCSAGQYPLGVDASGAVESCTNNFTVWLTNKSGGSLAANDTVVIDTGTNNAVTTTTSAANKRVIGVIKTGGAADAQVEVQIAGIVSVKISAVVPGPGYFLRTSTSAKYVYASGTSGAAGDFLISLQGGGPGATITAMFKQPELL